MGVKKMFEMPTVVNPFPGLRPFEIEENNLFFGRDGQSDELLARLRRNRLLAVVGTSGSGKSSLIRAGLLPALYGGLMGNAGSNWRIAIFRPGHDPIGNLAWSLGQEDVLGSGGQDSEVQNALIETTLRRSSLGLVDAVRQARLSAHDNLLVVVDQFEELFRFKEVRQEAASEDAATFVKLLIEASSQIEIPIYIVLTMRSDFLGDCAQFAGLPEAINQGQYLIPRMSRDERHAAITGPVAVGGGAITPPLVTRLLNDVGDNPDQLPILQHALMRTWDFCAAHRRNGQTLGLDHYEAIGTMSEALSRHADEAFGELPDERSQVIAEKLFKRLTERGADNREIRRPTRLAEICAVAEATEDEVIAVIDVFRSEGRSFLMPPAGVALDGETVIDISHESLIRNWKRLQSWVDEEAQSARVYRRLAEAAVLHREGSEGLLQDPALQIALEWRDKIKPNSAWARRYQPEFDESIAYLEKSRGARDVALAELDRRRNSELERERREREQAERFAAQQARAARRLRWLAASLAVVVIFALAAAAYAYRLKRLAEASEKRASGAESSLRLANQNLATSYESEKRSKELALSAQKRAEEAATKAEEQTQLARAAEETAQKALIRARAETTRANTAANHLKEEILFSRESRDAVVALRRGDLEDAEAKLRKLQSRQYSRGGDQLKSAWIYSHLGATWRQMGNLEMGEQGYLEGKEIQEKEIAAKRIAPNDPDYLETLTGLAQVYTDHGAYETREKARELHEVVLSINQKALGQDHPEVASNLETLAEDYSRGDPDEAEKRFRAALEIRRKRPESPDLIKSLERVAKFYSDYDSKWRQAVDSYKEILAIQEKRLRADDPYFAEVYSNLARLYDQDDDYTDVVTRLNELVLIIRKKTRDSSSYMDLATKYIELRKYAQAEQMIRRADTSSKPEDFLVARSQIMLAGLYRQTNNVKYAEVAYLRGLEYINSSAEPEYLQLIALTGLAGLYADQKKNAEAISLYRKAVGLFDRTEGLDKLWPVETRVDLAALLAKQGDTPEAERVVQEALQKIPVISLKDCSTDACGRNHGVRVLVNIQLADIYRRQGPSKEKELDQQYKILLNIIDYRKSLLKSNATSDSGWALIVIDHPYLIPAFTEAARFQMAHGNKDGAEALYWVMTKLAWGAKDSLAMSEMEPLLNAYDNYIELLKATGRGEIADYLRRFRAQIKTSVEIFEKPLP
jgi:tetratricopeptide (TPR) repeat protein